MSVAGVDIIEVAVPWPHDICVVCVGVIADQDAPGLYVKVLICHGSPCIVCRACLSEALIRGSVLQRVLLVKVWVVFWPGLCRGVVCTFAASGVLYVVLG